MAKTKVQLEEELKLAKKDLEEFKNFVKKETLGYKAGCAEGKREFLETLGLIEYTEHTVKFILEYDVSISDESDIDTVRDNMQAILEDEFLPYNIIVTDDNDEEYEATFSVLEIK